MSIFSPQFADKYEGKVIKLLKTRRLNIFCSSHIQQQRVAEVE